MKFLSIVIPSVARNLQSLTCAITGPGGAVENSPLLQRWAQARKTKNEKVAEGRLRSILIDGLRGEAPLLRCGDHSNLN